MSRVASLLLLLLVAPAARAADLPPGALVRLGDDRFRAGSGVYRLELSPDGKQFVTARVGGSYGAGNYGMCGRAYQPRMLWMWPNARISVMGGEQAAHVLSQVKIEQMRAKGQKLTDADVAKIQDPIRAQYETEGSPYFSTARLWDDGVLAPPRTRDALGLALAAAFNAPVPETPFGVFRM